MYINISIYIYYIYADVFQAWYAFHNASNEIEDEKIQHLYACMLL